MLSFRKPSLDDISIYFKWANDSSVRNSSYNSNHIDFETHKSWFEKVLTDNSYFMYIFQNYNNQFIGQVRIHKQDEFNATIGISIDQRHRGNGYAKEMIVSASRSFLELNQGCVVHAFIKEINMVSKRSFEKAGFEFIGMVNYNKSRSFHFLIK